LLEKWSFEDGRRPFTILTPKDPKERGAQISVRLDEGLLETVMEVLEEEGVVVDERRPDVVRVAPAPLYNSYVDVWNFMTAFEKALTIAKEKKSNGTLIEEPRDEGFPAEAWKAV